MKMLTKAYTSIISLLQHTTYAYDHLSCLQRHFLCQISAHKMCTFRLFDTLSLQINGELVKKIGRQTTLPKLLRRGDARRPLSGRFRPFLAPLQDAQHLKQAQFFTTWTDGDVGLGKVLLWDVTHI